MSEREVYYSWALREALAEEMERDPRVFCIGEDIAEYGGAFKVTEGLLERFGPERVRNTPISENSIVGVATGAAVNGMRPVAEIMFMDFITLAMDQLVNHAAKYRYMYGPQARVPLVVRTPAGAGRGYGATHSQSLEGWFMGVPGLKVVAPSSASDAKGLLKSAIRDDNPVLFVEHKLLYGKRGPVPEGEHGELVFTTLTKEALPVLRYRTHDITRFIDGPCACALRSGHSGASRALDFRVGDSALGDSADRGGDSDSARGGLADLGGDSARGDLAGRGSDVNVDCKGGRVNRPPTRCDWEGWAWPVRRMALLVRLMRFRG